MAGNGGGIGRFAARKKQLSQPDAPPTVAARAGGPTAGGLPNDDEDATVTAATASGEEAAPASDDDAAMEAERSATAINSFGYDGDDGGRPATSGSNVFSSLGQMFVEQNNDDAMDDAMDDGNVANMFFSSTPAEYNMDDSNFGQGYDGYEGGYQGYEGFEQGGQGSPMGEERAESQVESEHYVIEEVGADAQPTVQAPALLTLATAAAPTYNGGRCAATEGGGIGIFLKKRVQPAATPAAQPNATVTAAAHPNDPGEQQRHAVAGAGLDSMEDMSMADLSSFNVDLTSKNEGNAISATTTVDSVNDHREQQWHTEAGTGVNSMEDGSMANLSRFDVDITSKNAGNDIPAGTAVESVGAGGHVLGENEESRDSDFPSTIRTSDDDVDDIDDDLTEATVSNFAAQEGGDVGSKTSSYFSKPSNDQTAAQAAQQGLANDVIRQNTNCNATPPREDTAIPGVAYATTVQQPSSRCWAAKTGASKEPTMPHWSMETSKPTKKRGNGGVLGPNQGFVPRVSLSPHPGMNVEKRGSGGVLSPNQGSAPQVSFSPYPGMNVEDRPGLTAANQARLFSPIGDADDDADDDNSIVIPGATAALAHQDANTGITIQTEVGGVPFDTIKNPPRNPPVSTVGKFSTSLLNRQRSSMISSKNGIAKFSTSTEKVQFAPPTNRASATKIVGRSSAPVSKVTPAASSSTAITPDHRRSGAKESAVKPFSRSTNDSGGHINTPATHEIPDMAQALAGTTQYDSTHSDRFVPEMPTVTAGPKTMEVEPQVEEPIRARRPRSNTIYSPPPLTNTESVTPKASNTNPSFPSVDTNDESGQSLPKSASAFHKDENFDELLSQFVNDIQEGTDIFERGQNDLLELEVDLSHAFAAVLRYKDDYTNLLGEIESVMTMAECIMSEVSNLHDS